MSLVYTSQSDFLGSFPHYANMWLKNGPTSKSCTIWDRNFDHGALEGTTLVDRLKLRSRSNNNFFQRRVGHKRIWIEKSNRVQDRTAIAITPDRSKDEHENVSSITNVPRGGPPSIFFCTSSCRPLSGSKRRPFAGKRSIPQAISYWS
jgi:hypothetical protein